MTRNSNTDGLPAQPSPKREADAADTPDFIPVASTPDFDLLLSAVEAPLLILDRNLRLRCLSVAAQKVLHLTPADVGRPFAAAALPFDLPDLNTQLRAVVATGTSFEHEVQDDAQRWHLLRASACETGDGTTCSIVLTLTDIDTLKRTRQVLNETEARFIMLADSAPVLIWVMDLNEVRHANRAYRDWIGVTDATLSRDQWTWFIHPDDRDNYLALYRECFARRESFETQLRLLRRDGVYRWMKSAAIPRTTEGGDLLGYAGCSFDIDDLKQAENVLREADETKNRFLAVLAHELRTPLAAIANAVHVLSMPTPGSELHATARAILARQTGNMARLVDDLVDFSRVTHGLVRLRSERIDLADIVRHAVAATRAGREAQDIDLVLQLPDTPVWVQGDAMRLEQILSNLLGNAAKFSHRGGHIWLDVEHENGPLGDAHPHVVAVRVRDDGVGIDPAMLERIFEPFTQIDPHGATAKLGMGLGLALTRQLAELHGGSIGAASAGFGHGSRITVRLPALPPDDTAAPGRTIERAGVMRVLVVDDNADAADSLRLALGLHAFEIDVAYDGRSALAFADRHQPQIVLLDLTLPDILGWEVARTLRADARFAHALIVAISGLGSADDRRRSEEAGIDRHLTKPVDIEALKHFVDEWCSERRHGEPRS